MSDKVSNGGAQVFQTVNREARLSDKVTAAILETIASNQLKPGDLLPPERELGRQFGVSRTVIREAVRALAAKGMLEVRSGSGVRIVAVDEGTVRESMRHFVHGSQLDYGKVDEVRRMLEVAAAGIAAERATADDIAAMDAAIVALENECHDLEKSVSHDLAFHRAIATATHNELFLVLHDSMGEMLLEVRRRNLSKGRDERRLVVEMHRHIRDGIAAHEPRTARQAMRDHLGHVVATWADQRATRSPPPPTGWLGSSWVITSSSVARPSATLAIERSSAGRSSAGSRTCSAWPPSALATAA